MRLGMQARFILVLILAGLFGVAMIVALHGQVRDYEQAIAAIVVAPATQGADASSASAAASNAAPEPVVPTVASPAGSALVPANVAERIDAASHAFRMRLSIVIFVAGLACGGFAWLLWAWFVHPVQQLARTARRIEAGEDAATGELTQRNDEFGDMACAYATLGRALAGLRERMDHDADRIATERHAMSSLPAANVQPAAPVTAPPPAPATPRAAPPVAPQAPAAPPVPTPAQLERLRLLEDDLRDAWRRDELKILYQPIHSVADGSMRGAEALLRWQHPVEGEVLPSEFIPLAERSDLIVELGRQVLVQACSDASLWPGDGTAENSPFISVNVAVRQIRDAHLFEYVVEALRKSGLAAARLHLEFPAKALREEDASVEAMLEQLRGLGVQLWIDATGEDAGDTQRWMKPSISGVKVGQSHIRGRGEVAGSVSATDAIVATARALRIVAVVVGVEQLSELNVLKEQGADLAQGYVLCKPVTTAEIGRRLLS
ncbi:MAG: EAL domain-containing protein [Proteobacteria bacterium]|nr:EAL domain-containing protein [Pseudomonadota bacterium]